MSLSTVLIVDPNPTTASRVEAALSGVADSVVHVRAADSVREEVNGADVALVVVAATLASGSGYTLAASVREWWPAASVLLTTGGFEVFDQARAREAGVAGHIRRPFEAGSFRKLVESLVGPLEARAVPEPAAAAAVDATEDELGGPVSMIPTPLAHVPRSEGVEPPTVPVAEERLATFLPRDYRQVPLVRVDPEIVGPAVERAILEVLPEVVEAVLRTALGSSTAFRDLVAASVDESVRESLPDIATRVVRERLAQLEARADSPA